MKTLNLSQNYFELFQQPLSFEIDLVLLHEKQKNLQAKFHPDRFANASDQEKQLSVKQASWVNEAYETLFNSVKRARYILEVSGVDMKDEFETTSDIDFLMEQIQLREQIETVLSKQNPFEEYDKIIKFLKRRLNEISDDFSSRFKSGNLETAKLISCKMQFIQRILERAMDLQFQLEEEYN